MTLHTLPLRASFHPILSLLSVLLQLAKDVLVIATMIAEVKDDLAAMGWQQLVGLLHC